MVGDVREWHHQLVAVAVRLMDARGCYNLRYYVHLQLKVLCQLKILQLKILCQLRCYNLKYYVDLMCCGVGVGDVREGHHQLVTVPVRLRTYSDTMSVDRYT